MKTIFKGDLQKIENDYEKKCLKDIVFIDAHKYSCERVFIDTINNVQTILTKEIP